MDFQESLDIPVSRVFQGLAVLAFLDSLESVVTAGSQESLVSLE